MDLTNHPTLSQLSQYDKGNYICIHCNLITSNKKDFNKHIQTKKHLKNVNSSEKNIKNVEDLTLFNISLTKNSQKVSDNICSKCNKKYKSRVGLWYHNKKCNFSEENTSLNEDNISLTTEEIEEKSEDDNPISSAMILELLKQNNEFKELLIEQNKKILELVGNSNITNNNNNITNNNNTTNNKFN